jgi:hypothetical protein
VGKFVDETPMARTGARDIAGETLRDRSGTRTGIGPRDALLRNDGHGFSRTPDYPVIADADQSRHPFRAVLIYG